MTRSEFGDPPTDALLCVRPRARDVCACGDQLKRDCGYVFQIDALLHWKTALDNVVLGPLPRGRTKRDATALAHERLIRGGLSGLGALVGQLCAVSFGVASTARLTVKVSATAINNVFQ